MDAKKLQSARNAVLRFMELSHTANDYFFVAFAGRARLLADWTRDSKAAAEEFSKYNITAMRGQTAMYDACHLAIEKMKSGSHPRRAILLITDGQDSASQYSFKDVRERLRETGVMLYSIGLYGSVAADSSLGMEGSASLEELSAINGGKAFFPEKSKDIDEVFDRLALELRHQYLIGFKPAKDKADGKWHQLRIKVTPPLAATGRKQNLSVRSREGYYSIGNPR
jgi:Ca-activated chloride channel family protein